MGGVIFMLGRCVDVPPASEKWGFIEPLEHFSSTAAATRAAFRRSVAVRARSIVRRAGSAVLV
jgi:hypothetical protein